jgi:hypothetical protein
VNDYLLTIRIKFSSLDDIAARDKAIGVINELELKAAVYKLQQIFPDKQPMGIDL